MNAELVAIGTELLRFGRVDTNGDWLTVRLNRVGVEVTARTIVDDDLERISAVARAAIARSNAVLFTGGLGPTSDDRTREALAQATARPLEVDDEALASLRERFREFGRPFGPWQARQAERPRGASLIANPLGSAPGILMSAGPQGDTVVAALPGVPGEMREMFLASVLPLLSRGATRALAQRALKIAGRTEPELNDAVLYLDGEPDLEVTILSGAEGLELHLRAYGEDSAATDSRIAAVVSDVRTRLGHDVYGVDDDTLPSVVGRLLAQRRLSLAAAESCTAGMLGAAITGVEGASRWYRGGFVCYDNELKTRLVGVSRETIATDGAVSEAVARELAQGARERCGADIGLGITGVAGPGGGTQEKPVGLVHLGLSGADGVTLHWRCRFGGDRETIRRRAVTEALDRLRRYLR